MEAKTAGKRKTTHVCAITGGKPPTLTQTWAEPDRAKKDFIPGMVLVASLPVKWKDYIAFDPAVHHGRACIRGTSILVSAVLDFLISGLSPEQIHRDYPSLSNLAIRAAMDYAADISRDRVFVVLG